MEQITETTAELLYCELLRVAAFICEGGMDDNVTIIARNTMERNHAVSSTYGKLIHHIRRKAQNRRYARRRRALRRK